MVAGGVEGVDRERIGGRAGEARIGVARAGLGAEARIVLVERVAGDGDVVGRSGPVDADAVAADRGGAERARPCRGLAVGAGTRGGDPRGAARVVVGSVGRFDAEGVAAAADEAGQAGIGRRRACGRDPVLVDRVPADRDVVARGRPTESDAVLRRRTNHERPRRTRRRRVRDDTGAVHVCVDLSGTQCPAIDLDVVDQPGEPLRPDRVAPDAKHAVRLSDRARSGEAGLERAVDIETQCRSVEGAAEKAPTADRQGRRRRGISVRPGVGVNAGAGPCPLRVERIGELARKLFHDHGPPATRELSRLDPSLDRHVAREVERRRVGNADPTVAAVERQCRP